ncbi:MAG: DUF1932 domain-containing protein [Geodermatophilaceae bacterium]|nr:DUF1932 domain-containing protein [Geodermatophilaceae bacterium]
MATVGLLHPGAMGSFLGRAVAAAGHEVLWVSGGRSARTRSRATGFTEVADLVELAGRTDTVLSVCPPAAALEVAAAVTASGFSGRYVDANAISPGTVHRVADLMPGVDVIDGAVIGGPSTADAVLHLAGAGADAAAELFEPAMLTVRVLNGPFGSASALKACYALTSKAVTAALLTARAAAAASGVGAELVAEWERTQPGVADRVTAAERGIGATAWRFGPEMAEAAAYFRSVSLPDGFSAAAADVFDRLAALRDCPPPTDPAEVRRLLAEGSQCSS